MNLFGLYSDPVKKNPNIQVCKYSNIVKRLPRDEERADFLRTKSFQRKYYASGYDYRGSGLR